MTDRDPLEMELSLLREFYSRWKQLHMVNRKDPDWKYRSEQAAQLVVDAHHDIQTFHGKDKSKADDLQKFRKSWN